MKIIRHNSGITATLLALGLGMASSGALADAEAIKITDMPKQEIPGAVTIVDNRGAVVVENEAHDDADETVAENTVGGRVGGAEQLGTNK